MAFTNKVTIVISYWVKRNPRSLFNLLQQLQEKRTETSFAVVIVCNGGDVNPLTLPSKFSNLECKVQSRPNTGYNLGAWEHGWRCNQENEYFLFLQDDCFIIQQDWLQAFLEKIQQNPEIGLLGESISWQQSWKSLQKSKSNSFMKDHNLAGKPVRRVDLYLDFLARHNIPSGETAEHLQSLILFTSRSILTQVDGFVLGNNYGEAIASEIAISKKIQAAGYKIAQVNTEAFYYIGHVEWPDRSRLRRLKKKLWQILKIPSITS